MKVTIKTNANEIRIGLLKATQSSLNASLHRVAIDIRKELKDMVDGLLKRSPEYVSLTSGILKADFGLNDPEVRLDEILSVIKENIHVSVTPVATFAGSLRGGINIGLLAQGFHDILNLPAATVKGEKFDIPWLNWLLTKGDAIIVAGFHVKYDITPETKRNSLSGEAIMARGGGWRVPPQFSGQLENNWLTRTFNPNVVKKILDDVVEKGMARHIR